MIDLGAYLPAGFTTALYVAAAPYGNADGGSLVTSAQVPAGNGDGNLLGAGEYVRMNTADADGDGVSDVADPDADGDGLPEAWVQAHGLTGGALGDDDGDGAANRQELVACTDPQDAASVLEVGITSGWTAVWSVPHGKTSTLGRASGPGFESAGPWSGLATVTNPTVFPARVATSVLAAAAGYLRVEQSP